MECNWLTALVVRATWLRRCCVASLVQIFPLLSPGCAVRFWMPHIAPVATLNQSTFFAWASSAEEDARRLVEHVARRQRVVINEETRDLLVQQFDCSPFFMTALLQAARERNVILDTYLDCEQLYVDELMGGRIHRYFASLLEEIAPQPETRRALVLMLFEAAAGEARKSSSKPGERDCISMLIDWKRYCMDCTFKSSSTGMGHRRGGRRSSGLERLFEGALSSGHS